MSLDYRYTAQAESQELPNFPNMIGSYDFPVLPPPTPPPPPPNPRTPYPPLPFPWPGTALTT